MLPSVLSSLLDLMMRHCVIVRVSIARMSSSRVNVRPDSGRLMYAINLAAVEATSAATS